MSQYLQWVPKIVFCLSIILYGGLSVGCYDKQTEPSEIKIGLITPLSGDLADLGEAAVSAAQVAVAQINGTGGLEIGATRYTITLLIEDDAGMPDTATTAARRLIYQHGVSAIISAQISNQAIWVAAIAEEANVPMISSSSTHPTLTDEKQYVFRVALTDDFQGELLAQFAIEELNIQRAAVLYDIASPYNRYIAEVFRESFEANTGQIVAFEPYVTGETDFSLQLSRIKEGNAQLLFLPNYPYDIPLQLQQAQACNIDAIFLGSDSWNDSGIIENPLFENTYFSAHFRPELTTGPAGQTFIHLYQEEYGQPPTESAALVYDAFGLLFQALQHAEQSDPASIQQALSQIDRFAGATGEMYFSGAGDPLRSALIFHISDQKALLQKIIEP